ncbi:hypothetical protein P0D88_34975 [Paraburkholderia sp. RL18-103-BIB-C]|uniref:hypothetical protein n=1 Tax=Paraburkholderia sp. RL18-103-BIB-C TaxID=3031637 RepID=UPI0038BCB7C6
MEFTGRNLETVAFAFAYALDAVRMEIGSCPDVIEYADDIAELEALGERLAALSARIIRAMECAE